MKGKVYIVALGLVLLCSCGSSGLYRWGKYEKSTYLYVKNAEDKDVEALKTCYENIITESTRHNRKVPPGTYADYGYLQYLSGQEEAGIKSIEKEAEIYPESKPFIENILKKLKQ